MFKLFISNNCLKHKDAAKNTDKLENTYMTNSQTPV